MNTVIYSYSAVMNTVIHTTPTPELDLFVVFSWPGLLCKYKPADAHTANLLSTDHNNLLRSSTLAQQLLNNSQTTTGQQEKRQQAGSSIAYQCNNTTTALQLAI